MPDDAPMLTTIEIARRYSLNPRTVQRHARRGDLAGVKIGRVLRFDQAEVVAWLARCDAASPR